MSLELVYWPHPVLRARAATLVPADFNDELARTFEAMVRVMHDHRGMGLAGPQVAIGKRFLICSPSADKGDEVFIANPRVVEREGELFEEEGCLSFPGIYGKVHRARVVVVEAQDVTGTPVVIEAEDTYSRCLQHEIDHLDGMLFTRKMSPGARIQARRKLRELENRWGPVYGVSTSPAAVEG